LTAGGEVVARGSAVGSSIGAKSGCVTVLDVLERALAWARSPIGCINTTPARLPQRPIPADTATSIRPGVNM
jgi:hypothetical protein